MLRPSCNVAVCNMQRGQYILLITGKTAILNFIYDRLVTVKSFHMKGQTEGKCRSSFLIPRELYRMWMSI
jgi:hypothetical protein